MLRVVGSPLFFALAALALLLAGMECAWPGFFLHDDNASWFAGAYAHDFRTLTQTGELAEVNFYQYGGEPFLEQGQTAVLYPPVYLAAGLASLWPGDLRATVDWLAAIHLALAVVGFYAWLRRGGADARVAALGGLVWALNPFVLLLGASWVMVTAAAAWLPWLFWAVDGVAVGSPRPPGAGGDGLTNPRRGCERATSPVPGGHGLPLHVIALGLIAGLFVLQGYVQWAAYAFLFAGVYVAYWVFVSTRTDGEEPVPPREARLGKLYALVLAGLIAAAVAMPQVLPLLHGAAESKMRAQELSPMFELFYRVEPGDLLAAQVGFFREHFLFGATTALFFCPALVLLPVAVMAFVRGDEAARRRLFPLLLLAGMALFFSGRGYFLLNVVPFMAKFRWPFKVFLFAEFFLIAALVWSCLTERTGRSPSRQGKRALLLVVVIVLQVAVALTVHEKNFLSVASLPKEGAGLPAEVDLSRGRVIAAGDVLPMAEAPRFLTHAYATFFEVPSIGGYNPLVSKTSLAFSQGMDVPNFYNAPITPEIVAGFEDRAVRYWIVPAGTPQRAQLETMPGMKRLGAGDTDRAIYEDTDAKPLAFDEAKPQFPLPVRYAGNSMLIGLSGAAGTVAVSVGPADGWWYRVDGAGWKQSGYGDYRLQIDVGAGSRDLEVRYFEPRLRAGIGISLIISLLLGCSYFLLRGWRTRVG